MSPEIKTISGSSEPELSTDREALRKVLEPDASSTTLIRFGLVLGDDEVEMCPVVYIDLIDTIREVEVSDELWGDIPNTCKFRIIDGLSGPEVDTVLSGEHVVLPLIRFLERNNEDGLLERAVYRHLVLPGLPPAEADSTR